MNLKRITAQEAKRLIDQEGYTLIDVRSIPEFAAEHPKDAYNVPYLHKAAHGMVPNQDFSNAIQALFPDKASRLITSCQMGGRSVRAALDLTNLGYTQVVDLQGGFGGERDDTGRVVVPGWKDSGLPVEQGEPGDRSYAAVQARTGVGKAAAAAESEGHGEHGHAHGHEHGHAHGHEHGHAHGHGHGHGGPGPAEGAAKVNRYADSKHAVDCVKLHKRLPGLKRRPFPGPLGERIRAEVSADAWELWAEHAKMLMNEYRLNAADARTQEILMEQCEKFFFGEGVSHVEGYVPEAQRK